MVSVHTPRPQLCVTVHTVWPVVSLSTWSLTIICRVGRGCGSGPSRLMVILVTSHVADAFKLPADSSRFESENPDRLRRSGQEVVNPARCNLRTVNLPAKTLLCGSL